MPTLDTSHNIVRTALIKDGWTITHDPLMIRMDDRKLFVDLGGERLIAAEKETRKIAVEVKTFLRASTIEDLYVAVGQYVVCRDMLAEIEPNREVFVAVPDDTLNGIFSERIGQILLRHGSIRLFGYDVQQEIITSWLP